MADVAIIRQDVMAKDCGIGGVTPTRFALCLAQSSPVIAHSAPQLPFDQEVGSRASYRARKREEAAGEGGAAPNYQSLEGIAIPQRFHAGPTAEITPFATAAQVGV